jgi:ferredoxin
VTFTITEPCIDTMDQSCVEVCPVDCIHFEEGADRMLYIEPAECIDCGACQPACPVDAIFPEAEVPAAQERFKEINELWFNDAAAARALVEGAGSGAAPAAEAPADASAQAAEAESEPDTAAPAAEAAAAPAEATPAEPAAATALAPAVAPAPAGGPKYGENGLEGKCALCGTYVIKGGVRFREKSVLCPDCAPRAGTIRDPYRETAGRR